jgi:hypothetical protein
MQYCDVFFSKRGVTFYFLFWYSLAVKIRRFSVVNNRIRNEAWSETSSTRLTTAELGYNVMKWTEYFVSL